MDRGTGNLRVAVSHLIHVQGIVHSGQTGGRPPAPAADLLEIGRLKREITKPHLASLVHSFILYSLETLSLLTHALESWDLMGL